MTVGVAVLHSSGCVIAIDCRVTSACGTKHSDTADKYLVLGPLVFALAGDLGQMRAVAGKWVEHETFNPADAADVSRGTGNEWEALCYDSSDHTLWSLSCGVVLEHAGCTAIGSGSDVAFGYVTAAQQLAARKSAHDPACIVSNAVRAAAVRNVSCSTAHNLIRAHRSGRPPSVRKLRR